VFFRCVGVCVKLVQGPFLELPGLISHTVDAEECYLARMVGVGGRGSRPFSVCVQCWRVDRKIVGSKTEKVRQRERDMVRWCNDGVCHEVIFQQQQLVTNFSIKIVSLSLAE
jgi:hypothetical protein